MFTRLGPPPSAVVDRTRMLLMRSESSGPGDDLSSSTSSAPLPSVAAMKAAALKDAQNIDEQADIVPGPVSAAAGNLLF